MSPTSYQLLHPAILWCRRPESNRYGVLAPQDFKSCASASSATSACHRVSQRQDLLYISTSILSTYFLKFFIKFIININKPSLNLGFSKKILLISYDFLEKTIKHKKLRLKIIKIKKYFYYNLCFIIEILF